MGNNQHTVERLAQNQAFFPSQLGITSEQFRLLLIGWLLLIALMTAFGAGTLLNDPIHPLYLLLSSTFLPLLLLLFMLLGGTSLLGSLLLTLTQNIGHTPLQHTPYKIGSKRPLLTVANLVGHLSWLVIFTILLGTLFIKFSLQHYQFYLSSTLFAQGAELYPLLFSLIDTLPKLLHLPTITPELLEKTLNNSPNLLLNDAERAEWARWLLSSITLYGWLPRSIMVLYSLYQLKRLQREYTPKIHMESRIISDAQRPSVMRQKGKSIKNGAQQYYVALDFLPERFPLHQFPLQYLNDRQSFKSFQLQIARRPAAILHLFIDRTQTPDRSLLRRLATLMDHAERCYIAVTLPRNESSTPERDQQWRDLITPLLQRGEHLTFYTDDLSAIINLGRTDDNRSNKE